jgi:hypothetical protein
MPKKEKPMQLAMTARAPWHWRSTASELDWSDFRRTQKAKDVAAEQVRKHAAAGRDQSVAALKFKRARKG